MRLSAPTQLIFLISILLAIVSFLMKINLIAIANAPNSYWVLLSGFVLLVIGNLFRGA